MLSLLINATIVNGGTCFWIDGTEAKNRFTCYDLNSVGASMCCDSAAASAFVKCIGGICVYQSDSYPAGDIPRPTKYGEELSFWRDSCSDPRRQDPACLAMEPCMQTILFFSHPCFKSSSLNRFQKKKINK